MKKIDLAIVHGNCTDGTFSAIAINIYCEENGLPKPDIFYGIYGKDNLPDVRGKNVIMADFSYDRPTIERMHEEAESLVVIDHHKTAEKELAGLDYCIFDMNKSGCVLTWNYLFPEQIPPIVFSYVQDRDIWTWLLHKSKEVSAGLRLFTHKELLTMDTDHIRSLNFVEELMTSGEPIVKYMDQQVNSVVKRALSDPKLFNIGGYEVPCINSTALISEIGNQTCLNSGYDFSAQYLFTDDSMVFSLRSVGDFDVSAVCKVYGSGGHRNSAGMSFKFKDIDMNVFMSTRNLDEALNA